MVEKTVVQLNPQEFETIKMADKILYEFCNCFDSQCTNCPLRPICDQIPLIKDNHTDTTIAWNVPDIFTIVMRTLADNGITR